MKVPRSKKHQSPKEGGGKETRPPWIREDGKKRKLEDRKNNSTEEREGQGRVGEEKK